MILGIDIGTTTGWSFVAEDGRVTETESKKFKAPTLAGRFMEARTLFETLIQQGCEVVYYERVRRFMSSQAALVYCGILAQLMIVCEESDIPLEELSPTEIKKFAIGKGKASKQEMIDAAEAVSGIRGRDDNAADATHAALLGYSRYCA